MTDFSSDIVCATKACAACRSKKRKCDKILPACTRCTCVKQDCQYDSELQPDELPRLRRNLDPDAVQTPPFVLKSSLACSKCSVAKRKCSRDLPSCLRCVRMGKGCKYPASPLENPENYLSMKLDAFTGMVHGHQAEIEQTFSIRKRTPCLLTINHDSHYLDPFHTYPSNLSRETITRIFHYSIREMWPKLFPGMKYKGKSFTCEWMKSAMNCPPLFSAWLHSGAEHMIIRRTASGVQSSTSKKDNYELLLMRQEAIVALKEAVNDGPYTTVTDQLIMAAFALALHPHERDKFPTIQSKMAPLSNLQLLTRFTNIVIIDGHVRGLRYLVQARGGFRNLEMPGLREGLSTWDLIVASKRLTRPFWPLQTILQLDSAADFLATFEHSDPEMRDIHFLLYSKVSQHMVWVFHALRGYSSLLEGYADGRLFDLDLGYLLQLRNLIHYHVLSLPPALSAEVGTVPSTYEPIRLALAIYSLLVVFPVSLMTSPYPNLARLLRYELELVPDEEWESVPSLLLWLLTLGGIAALDTPHRLWFVARLHLEIREMNICSWQSLVQIMTTFIWLDTPCGMEGMILWKEIQQYGSCLPNTY